MRKRYRLTKEEKQIAREMRRQLITEEEYNAIIITSVFISILGFLVIFLALL